MKNIMILSGAGLSAPSGLKTFRSSGGLWEEHDVMEVCSATGFRKNPKKVFDFYDARRIQLQSVRPNYAHEKIAQLKEQFQQRLFVVTQNVDDLLERAGCKDVLHLHGFLPELVCLSCAHIFHIGYESMQGKICPKCKSEKLRHNIVMFEEEAPAYAKLYSLLKQSALFISIGTSGTVLPIAHYASMCHKSILNIYERDANLQPYFDKIYIEDIISAIDKIALDIENFMKDAHV